MAALPPRGIGEILSAAFQLYRRYWRTLLVIAAMVVVPLTLLQYGIGHWVRTNGQQLHDQVMVSTSFWAVASASLLAALVGLLLYQVLTGAITTEVAVRDAGELRDPAQPQPCCCAAVIPAVNAGVVTSSSAARSSVTSPKPDRRGQDDQIAAEPLDVRSQGRHTSGVHAAQADRRPPSMSTDATTGLDPCGDRRGYDRPPSATVVDANQTGWPPARQPV